MKSRFLFYIALACSLTIILGQYISSYLIFSYDYIPLGWDTAIHMSKAISIKQDFLTTLFAEDFINILYLLLMSPFANDRYILYLYETIIPPIILVLLIYVYCEFKGLQTSLGRIICCLAFPTYLIVYRYLADLHPALLGTMLSMLTVNELIKNISQGEVIKHKRKIMALITLSSMTHIETADFYLLSLFGSLLLIGKKRLFLKSLQLFSPLIVMNSLYIYHLSKLWGLAAEGYVQENPLLNIIGLLIAITSLTVFCIFLKKKTLNHLKIEYSWLLALGLLTSLIYFMSIKFVRFYPYLERAILTFPLPIMIGIIAEKLVAKILNGKMRMLIIAVVVLGLLYGGVAVAEHSTIHLRTWISKDAYYSIINAKSYDQHTITVFLYYDEDIYAGGLATMYDAWVTILYGKHYAYLGTLDNLLNGKETEFQSLFSKEVSKKFFFKLLENSIINKIKQCNENVNIVIINSFYKNFSKLYCDISEDGICIIKLFNVCHK